MINFLFFFKKFKFNHNIYFNLLYILKLLKNFIKSIYKRKINHIIKNMQKILF